MLRGSILPHDSSDSELGVVTRFLGRSSTGPGIAFAPVRTTLAADQRSSTLGRNQAIGADPTLPFAYLPTFDLSHAAAVDYDFVPEASHFLQMEKPEECAAMVREYLASHGIR